MSDRKPASLHAGTQPWLHAGRVEDVSTEIHLRGASNRLWWASVLDCRVPLRKQAQNARSETRF